jgi:hypothetical protein
MRWFNSTGEDLSKNLTSSKISLVGSSDWRASGELSNLVDGSSTTEVLFAPNHGAENHTAIFTFDFTTPVLPSYCEVAVSTTQYNPWANQPPHDVSWMHYFVYSSDDNATWNIQNALYAPVKAFNTLTPLLVEYTLTQPPPTFSRITGTGGIYGIVSEDGVAMPNRGVHLFDRETMGRIGYATTNEYGGYGFNGLNPNMEFMVLSTDPSGPPYKNAIVWDRIKPINTLSNTTNQTNGFWARRLRDSNFGGSLSIVSYVEGTFKQLRTGIGSHGFDVEQISEITGICTAPVGLDPSEAFAYFNSGRYNPTPPTLTRGIGMLLSLGGCGTPLGNNGSSKVENFTNLTFEHICYSPATGQEPLYMTWMGTRDSDDAQLFGYDYWAGRYGLGTGMHVGLTTDTLTLRCPLGGRNFSTVRGTATIQPNTKYHIVITYEMDVAIKVYLNGVLAINTPIPGTGRIHGWTRTNGSWNQIGFENWDHYTTTDQPYGPLRRITNLLVCGSGVSSATGYAGGMGSGWGGSFGFASMYHRTMPDTDVTTLYDSYINWDSHIAPVTQVGYAAEIEADGALLYFPMDQLSSVPTQSATGLKSYRAVYAGTPTYGAIGFVNGKTAIGINTTNKGAFWIMGTSRIIPNCFSVSLWFRPASATPAAREHIWIERTESRYPIYLYRETTGKLILLIRDQANAVEVLYQFVHTQLEAGKDYCIVVTYDPFTSKKVRLYLNGVLTSELGGAIVPLNESTHMVHACCLGIGAYSDSGGRNGGTPSPAGHISGVIGNVAVFGYELPAARVAAQYAARNT